MSNVVGNGWDALQGIFFAPQSGKYQINATFYWNSLVAGNRMMIYHYSGGSLQASQYCCIEGAGTSAAEPLKHVSQKRLAPTRRAPRV